MGASGSHFFIDHMATIALIWELGSDYGHIGRFLPIAQALRAQGHRPVMILRDISRADELLTPYGLEYLQAPLWLPPVSGLPAALNFTESLFLFGFLSPAGLLSITRAWRQLFALLKPELLIFDHAPTALLAARGLGLPRLITGNSFAVPPQTRPLPIYRWWDAAPAATRLEETESRLLENANKVLRQLDAPLMRQVADLYAAEATLITGVPELDVYGPRPKENYVGAINNTSHGQEPQWPGTRKTRIFAYLKAHYAKFDQVLSALSRTDASVLIFAQGVARQQVQRYQGANLAFSTSPVLMSAARAQCDLAVCHAGGTVDVMLSAGKPLLLLPMQMEQSMTCKQVENAGCGLSYTLEQPPAMLEKLLSKLLTNADFSARAAAYAANHQEFTQENALHRLLDCCSQLLQPAQSPG